MSLFTDLDLPINPKDKVVKVSVSNVFHNPSIAVMTTNKIVLFNESGEKHDYELSRNIAPTAIEWHPLLPQIAIGWANGTITLWNEENRMAKEENNVHKDKISLITFSPNGSRMVTADMKGVIAVWRGMNCLATYKKEGVATHCIFGDLVIESTKKNNNLFFFGGTSGIVCLADDAKHCSEVCKVSGSIKSLLFYSKQNSVIIITSNLLLVQFRISQSEKSGPDKKVKLSISGNPEKLNTIWIGGQLLSTVSFENQIRLWHLQDDDNYNLNLVEMESDDGSSLRQDKIACIVYEPKGRVIVAGTQQGNLIFWKNTNIANESPNEKEMWKPMPYIPFESEIHSLSVGKNNAVVAVHFGNEVALISETIIKGKTSEFLKLLQTSSDKVQIYLQSDISKQVLIFDSKEATIKGVDCFDMNMLIWTNKSVEVYEVIPGLNNDASTKKIGEFNEKCFKIGLYKESIILAQQNGINVANFKGTIKQQLTFSDSEGKVSNMYIQGSWMVMWTSLNYIRIFDLSRREIKQIGQSRRFEHQAEKLGNIRHCSINSDGTKVVIVSTPIQGSANFEEKQCFFYVYDVDMDTFLSQDLGYGSIAVDCYFDTNDPRLFGVLINHIKGKGEDKEVDHTQVMEFKDENENSNQEEENGDQDQGQLLLNTYFVTSQHGITKQDQYTLDKDLEGVFAIQAPYINYIQRQQSQDPTNSYKICEKFMNDFEGIDSDIDNNTKNAIINFSFHLSSGNLDEAFKSVKSISKPQIWEKMAAMSVKSKRIDVAEVCLGNMRFARGAKAIREAKKEPELEAQLAMVAIQLNMKEQSVQLYEEAKRYDLLNIMYQADGQWDKSQEISEKHDRMNLKNTHFKRAKFYEVSKNFDEAITHFELSGTHRKEVPRMLIEAGETEMLEDYIEEKQDKELFKFWAQYLESLSKFDQAIQFYNRAQDHSSIVRILCHKKDFQGAKQICQESNDPTACYYLAKQLEINNAIPEAIIYYKQSQYFSQASKLAREQNMDQEVMAIALQAPAQVKLLSAKYFEEKKFLDKAYELYKKGKNYLKARTIAEKHLGQDEIREIDRLIGTQGKNSGSASHEFNPNPNKFDINDLPPNQAVPNLLRQKKYDDALSIILKNGIQINDEMQRQFTSEDIPESKRRTLMEQIAEYQKTQANFGLACQLFIKLGDKVSAVKCLINLGAVDKVIKFAVQARMEQVYILAANFLQTTDWYTNPEMMKNIITFYNKARAYDSLAGFFDACSQVEIDEYRDYDKAVAALKESIKHANKSQSQDRDSRISQIQNKIHLIDQFIQSRNQQNDNPQGMVSGLENLLQNPGIENAVRSGDIYAQLIEFFYKQGQFDKCMQYIQQMQNAKIVLGPYLDNQMLQTIYDKVGQNPQQTQQQQNNYNNQNNNQNDDEGGFQEEELIDEDLDDY